MVSTAERSVVISATETLREESCNEIDLDGHRPGLDDDARGRDGGSERNDIEGAFVEGSGASSRTRDAARSACVVARPAGPRCDADAAGFSSDSNLCREAFLDDGGALYNLVWVPVGAHRQRRHRLHGLGSFQDLERLVLETVAR
jgi:hypothetical protein